MIPPRFSTRVVSGFCSSTNIYSKLLKWSESVQQLAKQHSIQYFRLIICILYLISYHTAFSAERAIPVVQFRDIEAYSQISGIHATAIVLDTDHIDWPGMAIRVDFQPSDWSGLRIDLAYKVVDWTTIHFLLIPVVNLGVTPVTLAIYIDGISSDGAAQLRTGSARLQHNDFVVLALPLQEIDPTLMGMRMGPPPAPPNIDKPTRVIRGSQGGSDFKNVTAIRLALPYLSTNHTLAFGELSVIDGSHQEQDLYSNIVDEFGQYTRANWPEKINSVADLQAAHKREEDALQTWSSTLPLSDRFGGFLSGSKFEATGFFRTARANRRWQLVTPDGNPFFSLGINAINIEAGATLISKRKFMFTELPKIDLENYSSFGEAIRPGTTVSTTINFYKKNLERKFGQDYQHAWRRTTLARLHAWGFNTIGSWSDPSLTSSHAMPYVVQIHVWGDYATISMGVKPSDYMPDVFDPAFHGAVDTQIAQISDQYKSDPFLIGYLVDNELVWEGVTDVGKDSSRSHYALALNTLLLGSESPAKRAFVHYLAGKYGSAAKFASTWGVNVSSWDALRHASLPLSDSSIAIPDVQADLSYFLELFADTYFRTIATALQRYDPHHLYLGSRFLSRPWEAIKACARYCDVVSFNIYDRNISGAEWVKFHELKKPAIISEFHFGSVDRGLFWPGLYNVVDEDQRGPAYTEYLKSVIANSDIVGCHWFQYTDQPLTGRKLDGENGHIGLVSVADIPYAGFVAAVRHANLSVGNSSLQN